MRYDQIKPILDEQVLDEVNMSPSALQKFARSPEAEGMLMGIEFEMCVPNVAVDDDSGEGEYDYDMDERAYDIDGIIEFFRNGEMSNLGSSSAQRLREEMWDQYLDWTSEKIADNLDEDELKDRIRDRLDSDIDFDDMTELAREQWQENNPDENPEDKASEDEIHQLALKLNEKTLDDMMEDTDSRQYQRAYDDIREEMEDEMRNDGDYDQQAWLSDIGVDYMSDAEREWGLDWPHWTYYGGGGELDVEQVGDEFAQAMGLSTVSTSNNYHGARRDGVNWIIEPDSSIDADEGDGGLEFVSPPMPIKDGLEMLQKMYAWAKKEGCYTNKSTGLHMNISVPDMTIDNLDYVKLALFLGDEHILKQFGREYNSYCKSAMSKIRDRIRPEDASAVLNQMKQHLNSLASKTIHSGITDKYTSINTKSNYVEFRGPGGDYLDQNPMDLINTALRLSMSLRIATQPEAYKQEYAKKLYKLISPKEGDWTDPNNSVALFSRYALGQINKSELVNNVRQAQVARKEKKGDEQQYWVMNKDGSGGKQMVFATSETEAIIKGGSQMGMKREESISKLKAELMVKPQIDAAPDSLSQSWKDWVEDTLPIVTVDTANSVRQRIINGGDQLSGPASAWIIRQIDNELRSRMDQGVVDGRETRWKISLVRGPHADRPIDAIYVDADTPRQAKVTAQSIYRSQLGSFIEYDDLEVEAVPADEGREEQSWIVLDGFNRPVDTVNARSSDEALRIYGSVNNVDTRNYTAVSGAGNSTLTTSREAFDTLPEVWQAWLEGVGTYASETLQTTIDGIANGSNPNAVDLSVEQRDAIIGTINVELRRRRETDYTQLANTANNAENAVRASLPAAHRGWLDDIANKSDMDLINVLRNVSTATVLNDQQAAYFRVTIRHELRRRGINPDSQSGDVVAPGLGEREPWSTGWNDWINNIQTHTEDQLRDARNTTQPSLTNPQHQELIQIIDNEFRRRTAAAVASGEQVRAQQQQALLRDDPVTSNDAEAQVADYEVFNPSTGQVISVAPGATLDYAVSKARQHEQSLGLSAGDLQVRRRSETNESLNTIRKLAGLA